MTKILKMAIQWQQKWEFLSMREGGGKKMTRMEVGNQGVSEIRHTVVKL